ncbi:hypothetical protein ACIQXD_16340 [Streptomyces uncialis]|uniref:hypothetical protein n=1 Tax=Streptomyces uncialis TaxID=1048205 RepID=UPI0038082C00
MEPPHPQPHPSHPSLAEIRAGEHGNPPPPGGDWAADLAIERLTAATRQTGIDLPGLSVLEDGSRPPLVYLGWCNARAAEIIAESLIMRQLVGAPGTDT